MHTRTLGAVALALLLAAGAAYLYVESQRQIFVLMLTESGELRCEERSGAWWATGLRGAEDVAGSWWDAAEVSDLDLGEALPDHGGAGGAGRGLLGEQMKDQGVQGG